MEKLPNYTNPACIRFVADMIAAGRESDLTHYRGRNFYEGPAVSSRRGDTVPAETSVNLQSDQLGKGFIFYPISGDKGEATAEEAKAAAEKAHGDHLLSLLDTFGENLDLIDTNNLDPLAETLFEKMQDAVLELQGHLRDDNR